MDGQRRLFFLRSAGVAAAAATGSAVLAQSPPTASHEHNGPAQPGAATSSQAGPDTYVFFNADEAAFIEAAVERLIPSDEEGPGAIEAAVPYFIDRQLAGAWGAGERLYRSGPWESGTPSQGYQLPFTPAELFRTALGALHQESSSGGAGLFQSRDAAAQDAFLHDLQTSKRDLGGVPSHVFFESLWGLTIEGYFGDPVYGGNRNMVGWRLIGFPGAYANYYHYIDNYNAVFTGAPISLADNGRGMVHVHPDIPAVGAAAVRPQGNPTSGQSGNKQQGVR